ncbi:uncharacterized protein [Euphorbia lathyris]|uniref:uncharacterized protein n=1 Tax=Euphorbia lathyris TaxID=212925 RepID=UPI0033139B64
MEGQKKNISRDIFSFPSTPQDSDFEFGCLTPEKNSPADHLFYNGKLLPHYFPPQPAPNGTISGSSSCKSSLMSSRSNSVNSSRSSVSCSSVSGRTSSSENWERSRKLLNGTRKFGSVSSSSPMASKLVMAQLYGSSQRWQHIVPLPLPVLKREDSKRSVTSNSNSKEDHQKKKVSKSSGICLRFFKSLLLTCRQCHAMEPPTDDYC